MSEPIKMPTLGKSVSGGTVTTWLRRVGGAAEVDEAALEVFTDGVDTEVPAPASGVLEQILVGEDKEVDVGMILNYISDGSGSAAPMETAPVEVPAPAAPAPAPQAPVEPAADGDAAPPPSSGVLAAGIEARMPTFDESAARGTVTMWLGQVDEAVEVDEPLLEVSTDKVDTEALAPASGALLSIAMDKNETVAMETVLALIGDAPAAPAAAPTQPASAVAAPTPPPAPQTSPAAVTPAKPVQPVTPASNTPGATDSPAECAASPKHATSVVAVAGEASDYAVSIVRKYAEEKGTDFAEVTGIGVGGRIRRQGIDALVEAKRQAEET